MVPQWASCLCLQSCCINSLPFVELPKAAGLISKAHTVYIVFIPPGWVIGSWGCWRTCFIIYSHRKVPQNRIINLCISPAKPPKSPRSDGNGNNSTFSLCPHLMQLFQLFIPCVCCRYSLSPWRIPSHVPGWWDAMFCEGILKWSFPITLLKDQSWRRRENVLVNDTVELLIRAL